MMKLRETILNILVSVTRILCHYDNFVIDTFLSKFTSVDSSRLIFCSSKIQLLKQILVYIAYYHFCNKILSWKMEFG